VVSGVSKKPLTVSQAALLRKAPEDWGAMPRDVGCTNATLSALEKRGLVETRLKPGVELEIRWLAHSDWQWRKRPHPDQQA